VTLLLRNTTGTSSKVVKLMKNQAAILSDGSVNVELLVTEIQAELLNDAKYKAEDGMKKRAVQISEFQKI
jgi:hypothetical protein